MKYLILTVLVTFTAGAMVGFLAGNFFPTSMTEIPKAEIQLIEYKKAEAVCGVANVVEKPFTFNRRGDDPISKSTDEFLCSDMEIAAMSEASRSAIRADVVAEKVDSYCKNYYPSEHIKFKL